MTEPKATGGMFTRVALVYPLAIPVCVGLAALFPGHFFFDPDAQRISISVTFTEIGMAFAGAYALIGGVFAKWGKR